MQKSEGNHRTKLVDLHDYEISYPTPPTGSDGSGSPTGYNTGTNNLIMDVRLQDNALLDIKEYRDMDVALPYLEILVQPVEKFRFRYRSEMSGTHGCLMGRSNINKERKTSFPTVALRNFNGEAVIRCSLYQCSKGIPEDCVKPHAHKLVLKVNDDDIVDPHDRIGNEKNNWTCEYKNMGIIHTSRKDTKSELIEKLNKLKHEEILRKEKTPRNFTLTEKTDIETIAMSEEKSINSNVVCLRFDAFKRVNNILVPICKPIYSNSIANLKSAMTGDLKITRMDHCISPASGKKEIYLLVEKVTRKNIKVRFFEMDEYEEKVIWEADGSFSDADVHHQYAIVFKTPPYKQLDIDSERKVYIQLYRPSDRATSEPKTFHYIPDKVIGRKRARLESPSSSSCFSSGELPTMITTLPTLTSEELNQYKKAASSAEFQKMVDHFDINVPAFRNVNGNIAAFRNDDEPLMDTIGKPNKTKNNNNTKMDLMERQYNDFVSFLKTLPTEDRITRKIKQLFKINEQGEMGNIFHECFNEDFEVCREFAKVLIAEIKKYKLYDLLDQTSRNGEGVLHIALKNGQKLDQLPLLPLNYMDLMLIDAITGEYPLHIAAKNNYGVIDLLLTNKMKIDQISEDGSTALQIAVRCGNLDAVKLLARKNASLSIIDNRNGNTLLHDAVLNKHVAVVDYLANYTDIDLDRLNFAGKDSLQVAQKMKPCAAVQEIIHILSPDYDDVEVKEEISEEEESEDEEDAEEDDYEVSIKREILDFDDICEKTASLQTADWIREVAHLIKKPKDVQNLYTALNFSYMLRTNCIDDEDPIEFLMNLALKNGLTVTEIRDTLERLKMKDAVRCIDEMT